MKHLKEVDIPARKSTVTDKVTCDLCHAVIEDPDEPYEVDKVEIEKEKGSRYPDYGSIEKVEVDMCSKCFDEKFIPWLESQGAKPTRYELEY